LENKQNEKIYNSIVIIAHFSSQPATLAGSPEVISAMKVSLAKGRKPLLTLVDMQRVPYAMQLFNQTRSVGRAHKTIIQFAAENNISILDVQLGSHIDEFPPIYSEIFSKINRNQYYQALKTTEDAFDGGYVIVEGGNNQPIQDFIQAQEINDLYIMGCEDSVCVKSTVEGALRETEVEVYVDRSVNLPPSSGGDGAWSDIEDNERLHLIEKKGKGGCSIQ